MILIGEKLNSSIPAAKALMEARDASAVVELARAQADAGANFIDINAGMFLDEEPAVLAWLAGTLAAEGFRLSVDSPSHAAVKAALEAAGTEGNLINSVTLEPERFENMTSLACAHRCGLVALCQPEDGEETAEARLAASRELVTGLTARGVAPEDIYLDPMLRPLGADNAAGTDATAAVAALRAQHPASHIVCGLSNLSFGLPKRRLLNRAFAVAAVVNGLDAAILDPLDRELLGQIAAAEAIAGRDEYCMEYIAKCREGRF